MDGVARVAGDVVSWYDSVGTQLEKSTGELMAGWRQAKKLSPMLDCSIGLACYRILLGHEMGKRRRQH